MNHPIALVLVAGVEIIVTHVKKLLNIVREFIEERIPVPHFIKNHQRKLVWPTGRHVRLRGEQGSWNVNVIAGDLVSHLQTTTHRNEFPWQTFEL